MKIKLSELKKIIKEEVEGALKESFTPESLRSNSRAWSWFNAMKRQHDEDLDVLGQAWDLMLAGDLQAALAFASKEQLDTNAIKWHMRQACPTPCPSVS